MATRPAAAPRRWPPVGQDQLPLLLASAAVAVGSFMPWVIVGEVEMTGFRGGGAWTFYAGTLGIAGALVPRRGPAVVSALAAGLVAAGIGGWQVVHLAGQVGFQGWHPGIGLVAVILGGIIALRSAWRLAAGELVTGEPAGGE